MRRGAVAGSVLSVAAVATALAMTAAVRGADPRNELTRPTRPVEAVSPGLVFHISEGTGGHETAAAVPRPAASTLDAADAQRVLDRLPPFAVEPREEPFARREDSLPPPRTGRLVAQPFPPSVERPAPAAAPSGPLEVLRRSPDGEVELAPQLSVTFSQPMLALDSHAALAQEAAPVRLTPAIPGEWRWVGTRTLLFEPKGRFPMATEFQAVVPAGTRGVSSSPLASEVAWSFATPPPRLLVRSPEAGPARPTTLLFAGFDQRVDPAAVLTTVRLRAAGATVPVRLATAEEQAADETVAGLARNAEPGRFVVFAPERSLPADSAVEVVVGPGTPSAEGPRRTTQSQSWSFRTYGVFKVRGHECGWGGRCTPFQPWRIETTNPIDPKTVRAERVRVEPELRGLKVETWGDTLAVRGTARGRTTYRVTLSDEIHDVFGQPLQPPSPLAFAVGPADPMLQGPSKDFLVLDPAGPPAVPVYSVNHSRLRVRAYAVTPQDWPAWQDYRQKAWRNLGAAPPGGLAIDTTVAVAARADELVETTIDLAPALRGGLGQVALVVEPEPGETARRRTQAVQVWVQSTRVGLDAFADSGSLLAWATSLADGRPLAGASVSLSSGTHALTDANGLARLPLPEAPSPVLVVQLGHDVAVLPAETSWWGPGGGWRRGPTGDALRYCVLDDRGLYRPGETLRVKGWLRRIGSGPAGDVGILPPGIDTIAWTLRDSRGNETAKDTARLSASGAFDLALALPATMNLGHAVLQLDAQGTSLEGHAYAHGFQVQEFRRPEFEVKATVSEGPHVVGTQATVSVSASYYAGGALPGADVSWRVSSAPASFRPPNREDFSFGRFVPWWEPWREAAAPERVETFASRTDGSGRQVLRIDLDRVSPPLPQHLRAEATVMDVNRQAWTASAQLLVHPALAYVGLRPQRPFVQKGEPIVLDAIATDLDGRALVGRDLSLRLERLEWEQVEGEWKEVPKDAQETKVASAAEPAHVRFSVREGGTWRVLARVQDEAGRANETELRVWVAGGRVPPRRELEEEKVTLVPDKKSYAKGEVAHVLVVAPFAPAEGLLTLRRSGLLREERFRMEDASRTLDIPVEEAFTPNLTLQVSLVGAAAGRPAFAGGSIDLPVPPVSRTLALAVTPREPALAPGGSTEIALALRDAWGRPVSSGEATVVVVDEAVLALTGYRLPDPLDVFYAQRPAGVTDHRLRAQVLLARPEEVPVEPGGGAGGVAHEMVSVQAGLAAPAAAPAPPLLRAMKAAAPQQQAEEPIRARTDFSALALFAATVPTDAEGRARVPVKLPDNLTRYRVMAVAVAGAREFGSAEATLTARLPLMVRPSAPRFLNFGDRFELPVVVQNQTDRAVSVDVAVRARNAALTAGAGRRLTVPANDRAEVRFPMAAERAGTARIQVGAVAGTDADAAEVELPVWTPATTEAFATYGTVDSGTVVQPVHAPQGAVPQFGGLEVTTASTALQALTDAVLYLVAYPFECAEQLSSRVLAVAALRDVLKAFDAQGLPKPEEIEAAAKRDLDRLQALQNADGGFGFWRRGDESWPYLSVHVAHALVRARDKGFAVPAPMLDRARTYLRDVERHIPGWYPRDVRETVVAYALYVRALAGEADPGRARGLVREAGTDKLPFEAVGFVLPILSKDPGSTDELTALRRRLANSVDETAAAAHFTVSYGDGAYLLLHSDRRVDAILLEALIADQPKSDLIPKLVEGLLAHRTAGRWTNTQENVFVLLALDRYFQVYEKTTPDFVARLWLGDRYAGEHAFHGRSADRQHLAVPMAMLGEGQARKDLLLAKQGPGRLYYRIGLRYAPEGLVLQPLDRGFTVERAYEAVDDPADVRRDGDGTWHVRAGARVRVRLTMVAPARRFHVALVDPLPAGFEALNPALVTTGTAPGDGGSTVTPLGAPGLGGPRGPGHWWWWSRPWFDYQNLRDERVEAFATLLWEGVHTYRYVARATTPGAFVVPPTKAEEMYAPETFGRGGTERVVVE